MLSFTVNALLGASGFGIVIQGLVNLILFIVAILPLSIRQRILPGLLLLIVYFYLPFLYYLYGGYDGSVLYFAALGVFLLSYLYKGKLRTFLIFLDILVYALAILAQSTIPGIVVPMADPQARPADLMAAVVFTLFGMFILARFVNNAYEDERMRNTYLMRELEGKSTEFKEQSIRDSLTGVYNRRYLTEASEQILKWSQKDGKNVCFIMLDIDHFKDINDSFGHVVGDEILIKVAHTVQDQLRKSDVFARYGGEEFMVVLYPEELDNAIAVAERIRTKIALLVLPDGVSVTVSLGVIEAKPGESLDNIYQEVDRQLYSAKNKGRNRTESRSNS